MPYQELPFFSFNGPETLFSGSTSNNLPDVQPVTIPNNGGGTGVVTTGSPRFGGSNYTPPPTNVGNPFGYGMDVPDNGAGTMPSGDDRSAYEKAMDERYANTVVSPGLFGTDIGKQTGYTGQGNAGGRSPSLSSGNSNNNSAGGAGGGGGGAAQVPQSTAQPLRPQDLSQRALSGSYYAPDMSAYNDSSLFNYTGPGGVDEYTYGQGLRTDGADYSVFGTPADMVNPYYEGQFAQTSTGVADGAVGMSPVVMPEGIASTNSIVNPPNIPITSVMPRPGVASADLNYAQQIESMGLTSQTAPSTLFPSPGDSGITPSTLMAEGSPNGRTGRGYRSGMDSSLLADENGIADTEQYLSAPLGTANPQGGLPNPYRDRDGMSYNSQTGNVEPTTGFTDTADDRFKPEGAPDSQLIRKVGAGMADGLEIAMEKGKQLQEQFGSENSINTVGSPNQFEIQRAEAEANQAALDKDRYQTQINNPTADFSGYMKNYGKQFDAPPEQTIYDTQGGTPFDNPAPASLSDTTDAAPMNFSEAAADTSQALANDNIFQENRETSPFRKGPVLEALGLLDEQQNYEVPASEMSPGETGLFTGLIEGLQNFGPNDTRSAMEQKAWDKYGDYKAAGVEALNKGEIDEKAFNELKGKSGASTVIDHYVDKGDHPYINSFMTNGANIFYQAMDVIVGDDTIKGGVTDFIQQGRGANDNTSLGSIAQELAKAKEATAQRKEVQENIFTPGPMKFAASARKPDPKPVVVTTPKVKVNYNKNMPAKVVQTKPGKRGPQPAAPTRTTGSRGRGGYSKPAPRSPSPSPSYSSYSRRVGGR